MVHRPNISQPGPPDERLIWSAARPRRQPPTPADEVVKLIDVSKCIGCKACQSACLEWNDRHERSARMWASMRTRTI